MKTQVGTCPHCGAPIYQPTAWWGINPPPNEYTCFCLGNRSGVQTWTSGTDHSELDQDAKAPYTQACGHSVDYIVYAIHGNEKGYCRACR